MQDKEVRVLRFDLSTTDLVRSQVEIAARSKTSKLPEGVFKVTLKAIALTGRAAGRAALTAGRTAKARREARACILTDVRVRRKMIQICASLSTSEFLGLWLRVLMRGSRCFHEVTVPKFCFYTHLKHDKSLFLMQVQTYILQMITCISKV
jgi:hypothetical protein